MTDLVLVVGEAIKRIQSEYDGIITDTIATEFTALAAAAFLPDYVKVRWEGMKLGLFEPVNGNVDGAAEDFLPASIHQLKQLTIADVKSIVIQNAVYQR